MKLGIPYSQFLRIRRNCSTWCDFIKHSFKLYMHFSNRGYPHNLLHDSLVRVNKLTQKEALTKSSTKTPQHKEFYCITEFNPSLPDIKLILNKFWPLIDRSSSTRPLLDTSIVYGYKQPKNIVDFVVHSDLLDVNKINIKRTPP